VLAILDGTIINKLFVEMGKKTDLQPVVRDYTLNLHKRMQGIQFKKRAPYAIKNIRKFARVNMHTKVSSSLSSFNRYDSSDLFPKRQPMGSGQCQIIRQE